MANCIVRSNLAKDAWWNRGREIHPDEVKVYKMTGEWIDITEEFTGGKIDSV